MSRSRRRTGASSLHRLHSARWTHDPARTLDALGMAGIGAKSTAKRWLGSARQWARKVANGVTVTVGRRRCETPTRRYRRAQGPGQAEQALARGGRGAVAVRPVDRSCEPRCVNLPTELQRLPRRCRRRTARTSCAKIARDDAGRRRERRGHKVHRDRRRVVDRAPLTSIPKPANRLEGRRFDGGAPFPRAYRQSLLPANSASIAAVKAGRSSGLRLVTQLPSSTTSRSTQWPPALRMSSWIEG
jgi:hypothetical protein